MIREYDPLRDYDAVRALMAELQDVERRLDPALPPGSSIADDYLAWVFGNCAACEGRVFVSEEDGRVTGFVTSLALVMPDEPDEPRTPYAWIGELVVDDGARGNGIGAALLERAEAHAKTGGARLVRTKALAANAGALAFYARRGYAGREVELEKRLG